MCLEGEGDDDGKVPMSIHEQVEYELEKSMDWIHSFVRMSSEEVRGLKAMTFHLVLLSSSDLIRWEAPSDLDLPFGFQNQTSDYPIDWKRGQVDFFQDLWSWIQLDDLDHKIQVDR